jgi:hypothetical protein
MGKRFVRRQSGYVGSRKRLSWGEGVWGIISPGCVLREKCGLGAWGWLIKIYIHLLATQNFFIVIINILRCKSNTWHYCA